MERAVLVIFPCTKCGACCRRAGLTSGFPYPANPDGSCSKLVGNECSIYADRPDICRVGFSFVSRPGYGWREYLSEQAAACNALQQADSMGDEWRVKLD